MAGEMTITRKHRILIAAVTVVGILCVVALRSSDGERAIFAYLERHGNARRVVRPVFQLIGREGDFDNRVAEAWAARQAEETGEVILWSSSIE